MKPRPSALALLAALFPPALLSASCGLHLCGEPAADAAARFRAELSIQRVDFELPGSSGRYLQLLPRGEYRAGRWTWGAAVPLVFLRAAGREESGPGNPVIFGEFRAGPALGGTWALGSQLEIPWGDDEKGLAAEHSEWLPSVSWRREGVLLEPYVRAGFRWSLSEGHGHAGVPLAVNPHAEKEFLYRAGVAGRRRTFPWKPELYLDGQHAFGADVPGPGFLSIGGSLELPFRTVRLRLSGERPAAAPRRFESQVGLNVIAEFSGITPRFRSRSR